MFKAMTNIFGEYLMKDCIDCWLLLRAVILEAHPKIMQFNTKRLFVGDFPLIIFSQRCYSVGTQINNNEVRKEQLMKGSEMAVL